MRQIVWKAKHAELNFFDSLEIIFFQYLQCYQLLSLKTWCGAQYEYLHYLLSVFLDLDITLQIR